MTLHDQLERLAERAEPDPGPTGSELWDRGTRYRRRMRAGTAAIAAGTLLGLAAIAGAAIERAGPAPEPAPAGAPVGLPSRIWEPSPWLPGTDEVGMPGQVAAVFEADRGSWTGTDPGVVAVSATTGDYRFLDLPAKVPTSDVVLSPDGTRVAYWTTGPTSGTPNTGFDGGDPPATGVAVLDLRDGELRRHQFETAHGLWTEELRWIGVATLVTRQYQFVAGDDGSDMARGSGEDETTWRWDLTAPEPLRWPQAEAISAHDWQPPQGGHGLVSSRGRLLVVSDGALGPQVGRVTWLAHGGGQMLSPDGARLAGVWDAANTGAMPNDVSVAPTGSTRRDNTVDWRLTRAWESFHVDGWIDDDHVAVTRRSERLRQGDGMEVSSVDVTTGEPTTLVQLPDGMYDGVQWATDLLNSPVVDRPAPPEPLDPRLVTTSWLLLVLLCGIALWLWRQRVQP